MPSSRRVSFSEKNEYSRLPQDDEMFVMKAFSRHANKCSSCFDPFRVYREGGTLCPKGHQRALDVAQYVYNKSGAAYSVVDSEKNQRVQIEIPSDCAPVRSLLKAMERGLRVMNRAPAASYDRTYYVPARRSSERAPLSSSTLRRPSTSNLRLETTEPPHSPRPRHSRSRSYSSRSPSPTKRPSLSRYGTYTIAPSSSRNNSYSSSSSRDNSPFSSRNNSISSTSSYGSYGNPSGSRRNSLSRAYSTKDYENKENRHPSKGYYSSRDYIKPLSSSSKDYDGKSVALRRRRDSTPEADRDAREPMRYYKPPVIYRIKREPSPPVPPKDEYAYRRRRS